MKLIFYKVVAGPDGKPVGQPVLTLETVDGRTRVTRHDGSAPEDAPLAHWRAFADYFAIV